MRTCVSKMEYEYASRIKCEKLPWMCLSDHSAWDPDRWNAWFLSSLNSQLVRAPRCHLTVRSLCSIQVSSGSLEDWGRHPILWWSSWLNRSIVTPICTPNTEPSAQQLYPRNQKVGIYVVSSRAMIPRQSHWRSMNRREPLEWIRWVWTSRRVWPS